MVLKKLKASLIKNFDLVMLGVIIGLAIFGQWYGAIAMTLLMLIIIGFQLYKVMKVINPFSKEGMVANYVKTWETQQLGHNLDSDYWKDKKKPNLWQKLRGIDPNKTSLENKLTKMELARMQKEVKEEIASNKLSKKR